MLARLDYAALAPVEAALSSAEEERSLRRPPLLAATTRRRWTRSRARRWPARATRTCVRARLGGAARVLSSQVPARGFALARALAVMPADPPRRCGASAENVPPRAARSPAARSCSRKLRDWDNSLATLRRSARGRQHARRAHDAHRDAHPPQPHRRGDLGRSWAVKLSPYKERGLPARQRLRAEEPTRSSPPRAGGVRRSSPDATLEAADAR